MKEGKELGSCAGYRETFRRRSASACPNIVTARFYSLIGIQKKKNLQNWETERNRPLQKNYIVFAFRSALISLYCTQCTIQSIMFNNDMASILEAALPLVISSKREFLRTLWEIHTTLEKNKTTSVILARDSDFHACFLV